MRELGINIDLYVSCPSGLQRVDAAKQALTEAYWSQDKSRIKMIKKVFKVRFSRDEIQEIYNNKEESLVVTFLERSVKRQERQDKIIESEAKDRAKAFDKDVKEILSDVSNEANNV